MEVLTAGLLTTLVVELVKALIRLFKGSTFDFPPVFYGVVVPVSNAVMPFVLFWLGVIQTDPILSMTWLEVIKYLVTIAASSLVSFLGYNTALAPLKAYVRKYRASRKAK